MNITDIQNRLYGSNVRLAASTYDHDETRRLVDEYQRLWDEGASFAGGPFAGFAMGTKRTEDSEEEMAACAAELQSALKKIVTQGWLKSLSRDDAVSLANTLISTPLSMGSITVCESIEFSGHSLVSAWNEAHPDEPSITFTGSGI